MGNTKHEPSPLLTASTSLHLLPSLIRPRPSCTSPPSLLSYLVSLLTPSVAQFNTAFNVISDLMPALFGQLAVIFLLMHLFAWVGMIVWGGEISDFNDPWGSNGEKNGPPYFSLNFNTYGKSLFTLFNLLVVNNWNIIAAGYYRLHRHGGIAVYIYFITYNLLVVTVALNITTAFYINAFMGYMSDIQKEKRNEERTVTALNRHGTANVPGGGGGGGGGGGSGGGGSGGSSRSAPSLLGPTMSPNTMSRDLSLSARMSFMHGSQRSYNELSGSGRGKEGAPSTTKGAASFLSRRRTMHADSDILEYHVTNRSFDDEVRDGRHHTRQATHDRPQATDHRPQTTYHASVHEIN